MHANTTELLCAIEPGSIDLLYLSALLVGLLWSAMAFITSRKSRLAKLGPKLGRGQFLKRFGKTIGTIPGAIPVGIGAALVSFGLVGLAVRNVGASPTLSALTASLSAITFVSVFLTFVAKLFGDAGQQMEGQPLIGTIARVHLPAPDKGTGAVSYTLQGQRRTMPARKTDGTALERGAEVMVMDVRSGVALVEEV